MESTQTEFVFSIEHIPPELRGWYRGLFMDIEELLSNTENLEGLEFYINSSIFALTDIYFQHRGGDQDPVNLVSFYHRCTTEAIIEMVLMDKDKLRALLADAQTLGDE